MEILTGCIFIASGVGTNLAYLSCTTLYHLTPITHGGLNKLGERVLRDLWCNFIGDIIGLGISRLIIIE